MKKFSYGFLLLITFMILFLSSCSIEKDDLEGATIYTTVHPIKYLTEYLYGNYGTINSIYPKDCDISKYEMTKKQIKDYSSADLFIYNGLTGEKELAKTLVNKNKNLLIIDVSYGLSLENDATELWLSPNNYLMLAKNIKDNLSEYLTSKYIIEEINKNYTEFEEKTSHMDAQLHAIGKEAIENDKNTIIVSNNTFKYLKAYGFEVISLEDPANLKENKLNSIKNNFENKKYKYILVADVDSNNELISELKDEYKANIITINTLTLSLDDDYFNIMTSYIENIKKVVS